jgi:hypothetical protein
MRLSDPDPFDGSPKNTETFINSCVNIFMAQPLLYEDAESQVRFALSFLKSGATRWRDSFLRDIKNGTYVITDWEDFENHLRQSFGNPHHADEARQEIHEIKQGSCTAEDFFIAFEDLRAEADFCDNAIIFQLHRALCEDVRNEVNHRCPRPMTYQGWKDTILQVDQDLRRNAAAGAFYNPSTRSRRFTPALPFRPQAAGGQLATTTPRAPIAFNANAPSKAIIPTSAIVAGPSSAANLDNILCWKCGARGHLSRQCTTVVKAPGKLTRQLLEIADSFDSSVEVIRQLLEVAEELPEDGDDDREMFVRFMAEHPSFFVPLDE